MNANITSPPQRLAPRLPQEPVIDSDAPLPSAELAANLDRQAASERQARPQAAQSGGRIPAATACSAFMPRSCGAAAREWRPDRQNCVRAS